MMRQEELIELLQKKKSLFLHFKSITEDEKYDAAPDDNADTYISVVTLRERDLTQIKAIDEKIVADFGEVLFSEEAIRLKEEIKTLVHGIIANEQKFAAQARGIKNKLQSSIKLMNRSKDSTMMYNHDAVHLQASRFDTKN